MRHERHGHNASTQQKVTLVCGGVWLLLKKIKTLPKVQGCRGRVQRVNDPLCAACMQRYSVFACKPRSIGPVRDQGSEVCSVCAAV